MSQHRSNPKANLPRPSKPKARPPKRRTQELLPGDRIVKARTDDLVWRLAHAARALSWGLRWPTAARRRTTSSTPRSPISTRTSSRVRDDPARG